MLSAFATFLFLALSVFLTSSLAVPVSSNTTTTTLPAHHHKLPPVDNLTVSQGAEGVVRRDDSVSDIGDRKSYVPTAADQAALSYISGPYRIPRDIAIDSNLACNPPPGPPPYDEYRDSHEVNLMWSATTFCNIYAWKRSHIPGPVELVACVPPPGPQHPLFSSQYYLPS
ncbi:MAG: hypothetical protein Q9195_008067 [Heterodermia aff. obscurata]